LKAKLCL